MLVQRVAMPARGVESWTVPGDDDVPIAPIERYLAYLTDIERSPNTVKAYAHDLKDYWTFLTFRIARSEDHPGQHGADPAVGRLGVSLRKPPGAANTVVAPGHNIDRLRRWALPGVTTRCVDSPLTRRYTAVGGSWWLP
ncbi:MAG: site-specific integrase [Pseudonocardiaceae bacterium]